ncbi:MAG: hypothetical protein GY940_07890, partial [bacterium]|nr:hypothetical protein [bacterium]
QEERERISRNAQRTISEKHGFQVVGQLLRRKLEQYRPHDFYLNERAVVTLRPRPPEWTVNSREKETGEPLMAGEDLRLIQLFLSGGKNKSLNFIYHFVSRRKMAKQIKEIQPGNCINKRLLQYVDTFFTTPWKRINRKRKKFRLAHNKSVTLRDDWTQRKISIASTTAPSTVQDRAPAKPRLEPYKEGSDVDLWTKRRRKMWGTSGPIH